MSLMIHNTLSNKKEKFKSIEKRKVKMYVCGVTVYDDIHMGHARSIISFDMIRRYLGYIGYKVTYVTNFTDVDDKIILRSEKENIPPLKLSERYIEEYFKDIEKLGVKKADIYPKASDSIEDIKNMISDIEKNKYCYKTDDNSVYFSVNKAKSFGCLTNKKIEDMISSGRIDSNIHKNNNLDFALWKSAKPGEISWDSKWGKGRPGWHIECSAMIKHYLGNKIDIHGGGNDLIFPHHENEILQTEAATGEKLSNYWMHNGMLQVKGFGMSKEEKMSKSLGNFFRVKDVAKKYDYQTIRFFFLNTHYRSPLIYSEEGFEEAKSSLKRIWACYESLKKYCEFPPKNYCERNNCYDANDFITSVKKEFKKNMDDDFNTPGAMIVIFNAIRNINTMIFNEELSIKGANNIIKMFNRFNMVLNILPKEKNDSNNDINDIMDILIDVRGELRKRKAYDLADMIRNRLTEAGVQLEDSADGVKWKKI